MFTKPKTPEKKPETNPAALPADVAEGLKALANLPKLLQDGFTGLANRIDQSSQRQAKPAPKEEPKAQVKEVTDDDINTMTNAQLMKHMMSQITGVLEASKKPIEDRVDSLSNEQVTQQVRSQIAELSKDPMFAHFKNEVKAVIEENPSLAGNLKRAFTLAKAENPDKVTELSETIKAETGKGGEKSKDKNEEQAFGGMHPTSRTVTSKGGEGEEENGRKPFDDAAAVAWEKTMGGVPAEVFSGNPD